MRSFRKNIDRQTKLMAIFSDTIDFIKENKSLFEATKLSQKSVIFYEAGFSFKEAYPEKNGTISVTKEKTFESAIRLVSENPSKRVAVLNFASATNPGGGVVHGASAQEESLCRCSTLYPTLDQDLTWEKYYNVNRELHDSLHTDACIYSPDIIICKDDGDYPKRLPEENWCKVDVITCAAPNLRDITTNRYNLDDGEKVSITDAQLYAIHVSRARQILNVAASNNVDILVLGAFGCGAFRNNPEIVATAYRDVLEECGKWFERVVFAIYCRNYETENYSSFTKYFK